MPGIEVGSRVGRLDDGQMMALLAEQHGEATAPGPTGFVVVDDADKVRAVASGSLCQLRGDVGVGGVRLDEACATSGFRHTRSMPARSVP